MHVYVGLYLCTEQEPEPEPEPPEPALLPGAGAVVTGHSEPEPEPEPKSFPGAVQNTDGSASLVKSASAVGYLRIQYMCINKLLSLLF